MINSIKQLLSPTPILHFISSNSRHVPHERPLSSTFASYETPCTQPEALEPLSDPKGYEPLFHCARWQSGHRCGDVRRLPQPPPYEVPPQPDTPEEDAISSFFSLFLLVSY